MLERWHRPFCAGTPSAQFACFFSGVASGRRHISGCGWQAMPIFEQATTPLSRWQMTQRSVHTAQPGKPDCVEPPEPTRGNGAGPSSSAAAGGIAGGGVAAGGPSDGGGAAGGASEGIVPAAGGPADGVPALGDAAGVPEDAGTGASAAAATRSATATTSAATARPTVMHAGMWVHEPRCIVAPPGRLSAEASAGTVIGRGKDASPHRAPRQRRTSAPARPCPAAPLAGRDVARPRPTVLAARRRWPKW
jgi:hypothetical protein